MWRVGQYLTKDQISRWFTAVIKCSVQCDILDPVHVTRMLNVDPSLRQDTTVLSPNYNHIGPSQCPHSTLLMRSGLLQLQWDPRIKLRLSNDIAITNGDIWTGLIVTYVSSVTNIFILVWRTFGSHTCQFLFWCWCNSNKLISTPTTSIKSMICCCNRHHGICMFPMHTSLV